MHHPYELTRRSLLAGLSALAIAPAAAAQGRAAGRAAIAAGTPSTGWSDFRFHREGLIMMGGSLNGRPARILIDSGVTHVIVSQAFARQAGLRSTGNASISAVAGRTSGSTYKSLVVDVGGVRISSDQAIGADLSQVERASGQVIDVLVGRDLFDFLMIDIDFPNRKIAFHDPRLYRAPSDGVPVPARNLGTGLRYLPLSLAGLPPVKATFDLGARAPLLMSSTYAARHGLMKDKRVSTAVTVGVAGPSESKVFTADKVNFAGLDLRGVPVIVPAAWRNDERNVDSPVYVGLGLLSRFRIITDYPSDRVLFLSNAQSILQPFRKERSGLHLVLEENSLSVVHVSERSPAAEAGWRIGERVVAVNGRQVDADYYDTDLYEWQYAAPGTIATLRLKGGSERRLILQDYY
ncbi:MAG TPA: aspartyl protease family protein [Allosphingosinicella sp.]|nr:aspartyl protease family protein [Allosphingosinicella sp.]